MSHINYTYYSKTLEINLSHVLCLGHLGCVIAACVRCVRELCCTCVRVSCVWLVCLASCGEAVRGRCGWVKLQPRHARIERVVRAAGGMPGRAEQAGGRRVSAGLSSINPPTMY
jgi:hypothetical protein